VKPHCHKDILIQREQLLRPDLLMTEERARRASISGDMQPQDEDKRMRQLTAGCSVWPGRRCASFDGSVHSRIVEMYGDGRPRQRAVLAYSDNCSGALRSLLLVTAQYNVNVRGCVHTSLHGSCNL
jgi:hypothetical protein